MSTALKQGTKKKYWTRQNIISKITNAFCLNRTQTFKASVQYGYYPSEILPVNFFFVSTLNAPGYMALASLEFLLKIQTAIKTMCVCKRCIRLHNSIVRVLHGDWLESTMIAFFLPLLLFVLLLLSFNFNFILFL